MTRRRPLLFAALASALAVGCGLTLDFAPPVVNDCSGEGQCGSGACVAGTCITPALDPAMKVVLEVVPASDALSWPRASVVFEPIDVAGPSSLDLDLPEETVATGAAHFGFLRVPVQVTFTPRPEFDGAPAPQVHVTSETDSFAVLLESGRLYDVVVEPIGILLPGLADEFGIEGGPPASQVFPPLFVEALDPEAEKELDFHYPFDLAAACTELKRSGCTLGGRVKSVDSEGTPVYTAGLLVHAVDGAGRIVSTSTPTGADGAFEIRITPGIDEYQLRVTPPEDLILPSVEVPVDFALTAETREVVLPRLAAVPLQNYVGYYLDGEAFAVHHAAVAFESIEVDHLGLPGAFSFRRTAFTEIPPSGPSPFTLEVFPGTYRVIVTPAETDRAGVLVFDVDIDERSAEPGIQGQNYLLPLRTRMAGTVLTPSGAPVPLAAIRARRLATSPAVDPGDVQRFGRSSETAADGSGRFVLPLDVGTFDLIVRPGEGTGFAWHVVPDVVVGPGQADFEMDLPIAPPIPVTGLVRDPAGAPLAGALVRAYVLLGTGDSLRAVPVGEATSDDSGAYELLLPGGV